MVYIRKSAKMNIFLTGFKENFTTEEKKTIDITTPYIDLSNISTYIDLWNTKFPLKPVFLHEMITFEDITYTLEYRDYERDKEFNTPEWKATKEKMKAKQEEREYQRMLNSNKTSNKKQNFSLVGPDESVKDFEKSISFGVSFIFSLFLSGLSGYYFGIYGLGTTQNKSLFLAALVTIATIVMETILFMIKTGKKDHNDRKNKEKSI